MRARESGTRLFVSFQFQLSVLERDEERSREILLDAHPLDSAHKQWLLSYATLRPRDGSSLQTALLLPDSVPRRVQGGIMASRGVRERHYRLGLLRVRLHHEHIW